MDKNIILEQFKEHDKNLIINLYEKCRLAEEKDIPLFGNEFYPPDVWMWFEKNFNGNNFKVESFGAFENAERKMISFNNIYDIPYPMKVLKISAESKFKNLQHKDFLGSILALGINRNKIGDLLAENNICYVAAAEDITNYLTSNLMKISNVGCRVEIVEDEERLPDYKFKEDIVQISSLRLDNITAKLAKVSRSSSQELIEHGKVMVNYAVIKDKSCEISQNDRIIIRGTGKFIFEDISGTTKSGKLKAKVKKFI